MTMTIRSLAIIARAVVSFGCFQEAHAVNPPPDGDYPGANTAEGQVESVQYAAVNAMLLNEFLREHRKVEKLKSEMAQQRRDFEAAIAQQQKTTETLVARLNEQEAQIQRVSTEMQARKRSSQILAENE